MKDYSLFINQIKNGDDSNFYIILEDHKKMIYKIIYDHNLENGDFMLDIDSLYQEGSIALYNAIFTYRSDKGMAFSSYAYMVIRSRINTCIRKARKNANDNIRSIDNVENIDYHISFSSLSVNENPIQYHKELEFKESLNKFIDSLDTEDQEIFKMRVDNISYKDISKRLKINEKRIDNRLRVLRKKLRKYRDAGKL